MYHTRRATLNDTCAISALFCATVPRWQRVAVDGSVQDVSYETLTLYERWLYGGAWMSVETAALWLSHLVRGAGVPLVACVDEAVVGYAEAFVSDEPAPLHKHLHIEHLLTAPEHDAAARVLLDALREQARPLHVNLPHVDADRLSFYAAQGFAPLFDVQQYLVPARSGQGFYQAVAHTQTTYDALRGWGMPLGRTSAARAAWETRWTRLLDAVPELGAQTYHRLAFTVSGQNAFVYVETTEVSQRQALVCCWTQKPYSAALHNAISDWAHRQGYRELVLWAAPAAAVHFGEGAEATFRKHRVLTNLSEGA